MIVAQCLRVRSWLSYGSNLNKRQLVVTFRSNSALVLPASDYETILQKQTTTASIFHGLPLATLSGRTRGLVLADVARNIMRERYPDQQIVDSVPGSCVNGQTRGYHMSEYDWLQDGRRIECKSSQLQRDGASWLVSFKSVKCAGSGLRHKASFDDLFLVLYTPRGLYMYQHDLAFGLSSQGKATSHAGHRIVVRAPCSSPSWEEALDNILSRLDSNSNGCHHVASLPLDCPRIVAALSKYSNGIQEQAYRNVPLATTSPAARGLILQKLVCVVDRFVHPHAEFCEAIPGQNALECDWLRDAYRIECKASSLCFCKRWKRWEFHFANIKYSLAEERPLQAFDELHLALYCPRGVYIYCHDGRLGLSATGKAMKTEGLVLRLYGESGQVDWSVSLDGILSKLDNSSCTRIALVAW